MEASQDPLLSTEKPGHEKSCAFLISIKYINKSQDLISKTFIQKFVSLNRFLSRHFSLSFPSPQKKKFKNNYLLKLTRI